MHHRLSSSPFIALVLAAACWGGATVITKHVLTDILPLTLLVLQLIVSVCFLWTIVLGQRLRLPRRREILRLGGIGLLNPGLAYTFSLLGLARTTASMSALLWAAEPILILGLAAALLRERRSWRVLAAPATWPPRTKCPAAHSAALAQPLVLGDRSASW
jgi:drug/metabolite transporter (DMT)-like permease